MPPDVRWPFGGGVVDLDKLDSVSGAARLADWTPARGTGGWTRGPWSMVTQWCLTALCTPYGSTTTTRAAPTLLDAGTRERGRDTFVSWHDTATISPVVPAPDAALPGWWSYGCNCLTRLHWIALGRCSTSCDGRATLHGRVCGGREAARAQWPAIPPGVAGDERELQSLDDSCSAVRKASVHLHGSVDSIAVHDSDPGSRAHPPTQQWQQQQQQQHRRPTQPSVTASSTLPLACLAHIASVVVVVAVGQPYAPMSSRRGMKRLTQCLESPIATRRVGPCPRRGPIDPKHDIRRVVT